MNYYYENGNLVKIEESETTSYFENGKPTDVNPADIVVKTEDGSKATMTMMDFIDSHAQSDLDFQKYDNIAFESGKPVVNLIGQAKSKGELYLLLTDVNKIICNIENNRDRSPVLHERRMKQAVNLKQYIESKMLSIVEMGKEQGKGKVEDFINYLNTPEPEKLLMFLRREFPTGKNKEAAIMITALKENDLINIPKNQIDLTRAIQKEWNVAYPEQNLNTRLAEIIRDKKTGYHGEVTIAIKKVKQFVVI